MNETAATRVSGVAAAAVFGVFLCVCLCASLAVSLPCLPQCLVLYFMFLVFLIRLFFYVGEEAEGLSSDFDFRPLFILYP